MSLWTWVTIFILSCQYSALPPDNLSDSLLKRISGVYRRMCHAAMRAGRPPDSAALVAVTKYFPIDVVSAAVDLGLRVLGESYVAEAAAKREQIQQDNPLSTISWHMIGHLQRNKVKKAVSVFDCIHSIDSAALAGDVDSYAGRAGKTLDVLIQVKLSDEDTKTGVAQVGVFELAGRIINNHKNLNLIGLMAMPPFFEDPERCRPYFRRLREIRDTLGSRGIPLRELSMGMSNDFEIAIEEGATMVRVGSEIFGER
ncbi:MAG: YggS family pyridoxal phosphate-dependent enzyme [Nitrospirae bacterium]|nr:YggS family pyridoxal phosphate-dependent enzyme [Nitrospirota bacterium]